MKEPKIEVLLPVGRIVQGSLYTVQTTDGEGKPLIYRTGKDAGKPCTRIYFAVAIMKGREQHWSETSWGAIIWKKGHDAFPQGQANSPSFAWKIEDGDSRVPNSKGNCNFNREGYPGHWIIRLSSGLAPAIFNEDGITPLLTPNAVLPGDYVETYLEVRGNGSNQNPGVFLNHIAVAFRRIGPRISISLDVASIGFGKAALPSNLLDAPSSFQQPSNPSPVSTPAVPITPHTAILNPPQSSMPPMPSNSPPVRKMTPKANGMSYESFISLGWTDEQLVQYGMTEA